MPWHYYTGPPRIQHLGVGQHPWLFSRVLFHSDVARSFQGCHEVDLIEHVRSEPPSMLLYRQGPMGDAILGFVLTQTLAGLYPKTRWHYYTSKPFLPLIQGSPLPNLEVTTCHSEDSLAGQCLRHRSPFAITLHEVFERDQGRRGKPQTPFRLLKMFEEFGLDISRVRS